MQSASGRLPGSRTSGLGLRRAGVGLRRGDLVVGSPTPRLWTPPLVEGEPGPCICGCALTPESSYGFDVIEFAREVDSPLRSWQQWAIIHMGELLEDGRPRFRQVLLIVGRQNGKSFLSRVLVLYWHAIEQNRRILMTHADRSKAKELWLDTVRLAEKAAKPRPDGSPGYLDGLIPGSRAEWVRMSNGSEQSMIDDSRLFISAPNSNAGRGDPLHRAYVDELRQHHSYEVWDAIVPATAAIPWAQIVATTNMGTSESVVLNDKRAEAIRFIRTGKGNPRFGLMEWSSDEEARPDDLRALAQANPLLNAGLDEGRLEEGCIEGDVILAEARGAMESGGRALDGFKRERMCIAVDGLENTAVQRSWWDACRVESMDMGVVAGDLAGCVDVSPDMQSLTLVVCGVDREGVARVAVSGAWTGVDATARMQDEMPAVLGRLRLRAKGFFPNGPAAGIATELEDLGFEALDAVETKKSCQSLAVLAKDQLLMHAGDPRLSDHILNSRKLGQGDGWRFGRRGLGYVDAAYACAGAVFLAKKLPAPFNVRFI